MNERLYKLAEYIQLLYKDELLTGEEENNVVITNLFLNDLRSIAEHIKKTK